MFTKPKRVAIVFAHSVCSLGPKKATLNWMPSVVKEDLMKKSNNHKTQS